MKKKTLIRGFVVKKINQVIVFIYILHLPKLCI